MKVEAGGEVLKEYAIFFILLNGVNCPFSGRASHLRLLLRERLCIPDIQHAFR